MTVDLSQRGNARYALDISDISVSLGRVIELKPGKYKAGDKRANYDYQIEGRLYLNNGRCEETVHSIKEIITDRTLTRLLALEEEVQELRTRLPD